MASPRPVEIPVYVITGGLTMLELARALATAEAPVSRYDELVRLAARGAEADAAPADVLLAATLTYALAWQYQLRAEPGVTWAEAQTWRVTVDYDATDPAADLEAELSVAAARVSGLAPAEAGRLTVREVAAYRDHAEHAELERVR